MRDKSGMESGVLQINGLDIAYKRRIGNHKTLVFIHGNSAGKEVFDQQLMGLENTGYTLIAIDLPGHGKSSNSTQPETDYNFPSFALIVKKACDQLKIENPIVVGWSLGGHVVIEMAGRGFDMAGAVIFGTPPLGPGMGDFEAAFLPSKAMAVTLNPEPTDEQTKLYVQGLYGTLRDIPDDFYALANRLDGAVRSNIGAHWSAAEHGCHQKTVVAGWEKPICVIHGQKDDFVSEDFMRKIVWRNLWRDFIYFMPKVGHAPFIEAPKEFNQILRDFSEDVFA